MKLEVHQPMTELPQDNSHTFIVVSEKGQNEDGDEKGLLADGCSRLRLKMEIHPISDTNFFHIVVQLLFLKNSPPLSSNDDSGDMNDNKTTDVVELLFLAESRRSTNHNNDSSQGSNAESSTPQSSPPLGDGAFVELAVGGQFFVINVLAEEKSSGQEQGMSQDQCLGLCHRVRVKVTKKNSNEVEPKNSPKRHNDTRSQSTSPSQWFRSVFPPLRRVVTDDEEAVAARPQRVSEDMALDDSLESTMPSTVQSPPTIPVCLQSWRVKSISSHGMRRSNSNEEDYEHVQDSEATMVAQGMGNNTVCRGVLFEI